jgi:hypothetical protein
MFSVLPQTITLCHKLSPLHHPKSGKVKTICERRASSAISILLGRGKLQFFCSQAFLDQKSRKEACRKLQKSTALEFRRGGRAAEGAALEMLCGRKFTAGSNPALSVFC